MPDAPDYTLLSDVNVVGSVTLNVNVVGSVTLNVNVTNASLNVNITGSTVTLNVNVTNTSVNVSITGQTINVSIINPTGVPLYIAQPVRVARTSAAGSSGKPANILIRSVTGRCRFLTAVIDVQTADSWVALQDNILNIIVDGVQNPFSFLEIATWNGKRVFIRPPASGSFIESQFLAKLGGWAYAEETTTGTRYLILVVQLEMDVVSSLEIRLFVPGTGADVSYRIYTVVGFYP
jgi:hypothetical protein